MKESVRRVLEKASVSFRLHGHHPLRTVADLEEHLPFDPQNMFKTLGFQTDTGSVILASLRAGERLDYGRMASLVGIKRQSISTLSETSLGLVLGFEPGGLTPLVEDTDVMVVLDCSLAEAKTVYCGTGEATSTLEIAGSDLLQAVPHAIIGDIAKQSV